MLLYLLQDQKRIKTTNEDDCRTDASIGVHCAVRRINVEKRQYEQQDIGALSAATVRPVQLFAIGDEVPVRQHSALGGSRRAGGITNRRDVARAIYAISSAL
jgi:hypothetical protein